MLTKLALLGAMAVFVVGCGSSATPTPSASPAETGEPSAATSPGGPTGRTVDIEIAAGKITPASIEVKKGETITFNAKNVSDTEVELIVGLKTDVDTDSGDSLKEAEAIAPGTSKTVTYTFDGDGPYAFGDQIGDHYAKGAKGLIVLQP
jgi:uncharacterized cupredoxin-like copper-binding protein